jgi:predicted secreted protein
MPRYTIIDTSNDTEYETQCSWDELQIVLNKNPNLKQGLSTPNFVTQTGNTISKTSTDWRDLLKKVKKGSGKGNTINV